MKKIYSVLPNLANVHDLYFYICVKDLYSCTSYFCMFLSQTSPVQRWIFLAGTCAMCGAASARRGGAWAAPRREQSTRCQCCPDHHHHHDDNDGDNDGNDDNNDVYDDHDADIQNPPNVIWHLSNQMETAQQGNLLIVLNVAFRKEQRKKVWIYIVKPHGWV